MIELMRKNLQQATRHINDAHAGLLIQRGLTHWQTEYEVKELKKKHEKTIKEKLIDTISSIKPSDLYFQAFNRWLMLTHKQPAFATLGARVAGRLYTGLPLGGTLETGAATHHSYGMPMLAGSSIKGAVRSYTERLFALKNEDGSYQLKKDENGTERLIIDPEKQYIIDVLFGKESEDGDEHQGDAGYLVWHDAWWIPQTNKDNKTLSHGEQNKPFINEVVTVHHQKYYKGDLKEALDIENPIPNQQIAIRGEFYFVIEGEPEWAEYAKQLLEDTLTDTGLGSKTASGYGYFEMNTPIFNEHLAVIEQLEQERIEAEETHKLEQIMADLNENQKLICLFKHALLKLEESKWKNKSPDTINIDTREGAYCFATLFKVVENWNLDDQRYALEEVFLPYLPEYLGCKISKNKRWKERINPMREKLGI